MPAGDQITSDIQVELRGLLIGEGTNYPITGPIQGLGDLEVRTSNPARPLDHGRYAGRAFYGSRQLIVPVAVLGADQADAMSKLVELGAAMRVPTHLDGGYTVPFVLRLGGMRLCAFGKPMRMHVDPTHLPKGAAIECTLEFVATDPRLYSDPKSASASTAEAVGGLDMPHAFPHMFGNATPSTAAVVNAGNFSTYPTLRVTGGVGGMVDFLATKTSTLETMSMSITLSAGEWIELDFGARTALLGGTASRANLIDRPESTWFELDPGPNNITFAVSSGAATFSVSWRDAYIFG